MTLRRAVIAAMCSILCPALAVKVTLHGFSHTNPEDIDILLAAPDGEDLSLVTDVGRGFDNSNLELGFAVGGELIACAVARTNPLISRTSA